MLYTQYFHNTFTKNFKWQIIISRKKKSNLSYKFKLKLITTYQL